MRFARGMLGLAVTTVAIMGTILMGFALSAETKTVQYDDWDYLANVSGMFDTDQTPQYIEYNPAANWTGFSTDKDHRDTSGIEYTTSPNANLYPIKQQSTSSSFNTTLGDVDMPVRRPVRRHSRAGVWSSTQRIPSSPSMDTMGVTSLVTSRPLSRSRRPMISWAARIMISL